MKKRANSGVPFDLARFTDVQDLVLDIVQDELRAGRKQTHWMWFTFPQLRDLERSPSATFYGVSSFEEARAYLAHTVLGPRLHELTALVLDIPDRSATEIFGSPDDLMLSASMTLFSVAAGSEGALFQRALERFFDGILDEATLTLMRADGEV